MKQLTLLFALIPGIFISCTDQTSDGLRLNHIQLIGSHNSYKIGIEEPLMQLLIAEDSQAIGLNYRHLSITEQLDLGIRGLELDVLFDPQGGQFTRPIGLDLLDSLGLDSQPYDLKNELSQPGFKVFHIPDIDFRSHCLTFKGCLSDIKLWSQKNRDHLPIIITINPKNSGVEKPSFTEVIPFSEYVLDSLDKEIVSVFDESDLITPTLVKGDAATMKDAIANTGWPLVEKVRGKVMFVLDASERVTQDYLNSYRNGKPMFVNVPKDDPWAGFFIMNDPIRQEAKIKELVSQGFMVRTRSDANTTEARTNDKSRSLAAFRSGAQLISTDYYLKELSPNQDFSVWFGDGIYQRCNPVTSNKNCSL